MDFSRNKVDAVSSRAVDAESGEDASSTLFREFDFSEAAGHLSGNLPHWRQDGATYYITFARQTLCRRRSSNSGLDERTAWLRVNKGPYSAAHQRDYWKKFPALMMDLHKFWPQLKHWN